MIALASEPVVSVICDEPEGSIERHVYPMALTPENIKTFWDKASQHRVLFTDEINGDFGRFCEVFIGQRDDGKPFSRGLFWRIDDFIGMYYMTEISLYDAIVHFTFFDGRYRGRAKLTKEMLSYGFNRYGFRRLSTEIPLYAPRFTFGFVNKLGFKSEGRKRKAVEYKGEWFDIALFGILREEVNGHEIS